MTYSTIVWEHFHHPKNLGEFDKRDPQVGTGFAGAPERGDVVQIQIKINAENIIIAAKFKAQASVATIAACSWLTESIKGQSLQAAKKIDYKEIATALALTPLKIHCAAIVVDALLAAIQSLHSKLKEMLPPVNTPVTDG